MQLVLVVLLCAAGAAALAPLAAAEPSDCVCSAGEKNGTNAAGEPCMCPSSSGDDSGSGDGSGDGSGGGGGHLGGCILVVSGCAVGGLFVFAIGAQCCLSMLGCRRVGIREGSAAAEFQSVFGTPVVFRSAQSAGMTGQIPMACRLLFGVLGAAAMGAAAFYLSPYCRLS